VIRGAITIAVVALAAALPPVTSAAMRVSVAGPRLAPAGVVRVVVTGARPRSRAVVTLRLDGVAVRVATRRTSRRGRVAVPVPYAALAPTVDAHGLVGPLTATVTAAVHGTRRTRSLPVQGLAPDPLELTITPLGPVGYDEVATFHVAGLRPVGPPVELRFVDCAEVVQRIVVPRGAVAVDVPFLPGVGPRAAIERSCFADGQPELDVLFSAGVVLDAGYASVATVTATLMPPRSG